MAEYLGGVWVILPMKEFSNEEITEVASSEPQAPPPALASYFVISPSGSPVEET